MADIGSVAVKVVPVLDEDAMAEVVASIVDRVKVALSGVIRDAVRESVQVQIDDGSHLTASADALWTKRS